MRPILPHPRQSLIAAALLVGLLLPLVVFAAPSPEWRERSKEARLLAPAVGERAVETAIRFAYELPKGSREAHLLVSRRPFQPAGWTEIEPRPDLVVVDAGSAAPTLEEAGVTVDSDTPLWWALSWRDPLDGGLRFSEVRPFTALRRFANRVAASPVVLQERSGRLPESETAPRRAALASHAVVPARPQVHLVAGYDFVPGETQPAVPAALAHVLRTPEDGADPVGAFLVQFADPPGEAERAAIAEAGGAIVSYVPDQAFLVRMAGSSLERLSLTRGDVAVAEYLPAYKVSPRVDRATPGSGAFQARLFSDADLARAERELVDAGASGVEIHDNGINRIARFTLDRSQVAVVATLSGVEWIEPRPVYTMDNDNAQWVTQTATSGNRRIWTAGLRGQGQVVMTTDSGVRTDHNQFVDPLVPITAFGEYPTHRKIIAYQQGAPDPQIAFGDHSGASYHGTHTAGTICGNDDPTANASARDGMAKEAKLWFMDLSGPALANGISPPADLNDLFQPGYTGNAGGAARLASNSWGSAASGAYSLNSMQVDQFMWSHPDFFIAFSNGNSGSAGSVGEPASAKNSGGVGGTGNGTSQNNIYSSTSRGPTADGRRKPTYCAPGSAVYSANGAGTTGYVSLSGTSMASPAATGAMVLMRQYLTDGWYPTGAAVPANGFSPSAALLKAMAINSAVDSMTSNLAPNNNIGFGRICVDSVLYFAGDSRRLVLLDHTQGLGLGEFVEYQVRVTTSTIPLKVSLCWTDYPGNPAASRQLVNDLDLTVTNGAYTFLGNVFSGRKSIIGGSRDSLNVEEGVRVPMPGTGVWTIRVAAEAVPIGPQPFALVVTGGLGEGGGTLAMDRTLYGPSGTVQLQVTDPDATGPLTVTVASGTESTPENVTLTGGNGVYEGSIALTNLLPAADGNLSVSNGDLITASYLDATYSATLTAQANVDIDPPIITGVRATSQGVAGTLVSWTTDRNADSRVYWGATPALEMGAVTETDFRLAHGVLLTGLTPGQTYYYDVESEGLAGGIVRDDLGGAHRRFTAKGQGDVLLLLGAADFPRLSTWTTALDALGYDYDVWSGATADSAAVGGLAAGLRSYKAVLWQVGPNTYPGFSDLQRGSIDSLLAGGGRLMVTGHDIGWGLVDPTSPGYTAARAAWVQSSLRVTFKTDPTYFDVTSGFAGDPVSSPNVAGVSYEAWGTSGQSGDEIGTSYDPAVGSAGVWRDNDATPDTTTIRWETVAPVGSPANASWGGHPSRLLAYFHEWSGMVSPAATPDTTRNGILDRSIQWLLGRGRPVVAITAPNGGEVLTTTTVNLTWNETVSAGLSVSGRTIEYSLDGGDSWVTLATGAGASPYAWNTAGIPNSANVKVRVRITDDGDPALAGSDVSDAAFQLMRPGEDTQGPVIVPGSIQPTPNPIVIASPATLLARGTDAQTGGATIAAAEYSIGAAPAAAGSGTAMTSTFDSVSVNLSVAINTNVILSGDRTIWVRARDAQGNWGPASSIVVRVNGTDPVSVGESPAVTFLAPGAPNPSAGALRLRFGLASPSRADLAIFDAAGRRVRTVASGAYGPGVYSIAWDGRDASGGSAAPGLYFVRLKTDDATFERRIIRLN